MCSGPCSLTTPIHYPLRTPTPGSPISCRWHRASLTAELPHAAPTPVGNTTSYTLHLPKSSWKTQSRPSLPWSWAKSSLVVHIPIPVLPRHPSPYHTDRLLPKDLSASLLEANLREGLLSCILSGSGYLVQPGHTEELHAQRVKLWGSLRLQQLEVFSGRTILQRRQHQLQRRQLATHAQSQEEEGTPLVFCLVLFSD